MEKRFDQHSFRNQARRTRGKLKLMIFVCQLSSMIAVFILAGMGGHTAFADQSGSGGYETYKAGNYTASFKIWKAKAERGDINAQNNLAMLYINGRGVSQNYQEAKKWLQAAADHGSIPAKINLGTLYATGHGVEKNVVAAYQLWKEIADIDPVARMNLDKLCSYYESICQHESWQASR